MSYQAFGPYPVEGDALLWRVVEASPGGSDAWEIDLQGLMKCGHTVLWQCDIITGSGTVQPELGEEAGWTTDEAGHIAQADTAAAHHRIGEYKNFVVRDGKLHGRSNASSSPGKVETRICLKRGPAL